ncbi:MAG: hypothetical protein JHD16_01305 [Solirubrobacteraceae bacterium]|nr:hypothetical protein [Solirubrobacteraceae bacterium]
MSTPLPHLQVEHPGRDHALALQRFVGGVQVFGGTTLLLAYSLGATSLDVGPAAQLLVGLGVIQALVGALFVAQPRRLRGWVLRRPGTLVACALAAATVVIALGGSGPARAYITGAQCWLILAGLALPGRRWIAGLTVMACVVVPTWVVVDGDVGGFEGNGAFATAFLAFGASVAAGLWMGRVTGSAAATLNRWHLVEVHELGVVDRLRHALADVRREADRLAAALRQRGDDLSPELRLLRERLAQEADLGESTVQHTTQLDTLLERISRELLDPDGPTLEVEVSEGTERVALRAVVADALLSVIRRQIDNVIRHAPGAHVILVSADLQRGVLLLRIEDDGGGTMPTRAGVGSAWSQRQLARVGGTARYFAGEHGVGLEVQVEAKALPTAAELGTLSVHRELERFGFGLLDAVRLAGYVGDTLTATSVSDSFGETWMLMAAGAIVIEGLIRAGRGGVGGLDPIGGAVLASVVSALLAAAFAWSPNGPDTVVPATTSVLVPAIVLLTAGRNRWLVAEALRLAAVAPLLAANAAGSAGLLVVYPFGVYLLVRTILRFTERASGLEERAADALGRASLAAAIVRGLSLQHDAINVLARHTTDASTVAAATALERALAALDRAARSSVDPQEIVTAGLAAALGGTLAPGDRPGAEAAAGAVDRITLFELAALAADERASCTPQGMLGRRRLVRVEPQWHRSDGSTLVLSLVAQPSLGPPEPDRLRDLRLVAEALGIGVRSTPDALTLSYARQ